MYWYIEHLWCVISGHAMPIRSLTFSPDSQLLITASDDGHIKMYDVYPLCLYRKTPDGILRECSLYTQRGAGQEDFTQLSKINWEPLLSHCNFLLLPPLFYLEIFGASPLKKFRIFWSPPFLKDKKFEPNNIFKSKNQEWIFCKKSTKL